MNKKNIYNEGVASGLRLNDNVLESINEKLQPIEKIKGLPEIVENLVKDNEGKDIENLFKICRETTADDLEKEEKIILLNLVATIKNEININEMQNRFLNNLRHYLSVSCYTINNHYDYKCVKSLENVKSIRFIVKALRIFLYLSDCNWDVVNEFEDKLFSKFELSKESFYEIDKIIELFSELFENQEGLIEFYGDFYYEPVNNTNIQYEFSDSDYFKLKTSLDFSMIALEMERVTTNMTCTTHKLEHFDVDYQLLNDEDAKKIIEQNKIKNTYLTNILREEFYTSKEAKTNDYSVLFWENKAEEYPKTIVFNKDGVFYDCEDCSVFFKYVDITNIWEDDMYVRVSPQTIFAVNDSLDEIVFEDDKEREVCIEFADDKCKRIIRHHLERIASFNGNNKTVVYESQIEDIIEKYIVKFVRNKNYNYYLSKLSADENYYKIEDKSVSSYVGIDRSRIVAIVDTAVINHGKNAFVFTYDGIYFKFLLKKHFIKYDDLRMWLSKDHKKMYLFGSDNQSDDLPPWLDDLIFDLQVLYDCIAEIQQIM